MRKKIVIVLLVLLSCTGVFLLLKISTWHAVFLFSEKDLEWLAPYHDVGWSLTNTGLTYSIQNAENGKQPLVLQQNYHYDWEALLQVLGVKVI